MERLADVEGSRKGRVQEEECGAFEGIESDDGKEQGEAGGGGSIVFKSEAEDDAQGQKMTRAATSSGDDPFLTRFIYVYIYIYIYI